MPNITVALIKELRDRSGIGVMECKKALIEASGDIEIAIDNIHKHGLAKAIQKSNRVVTEGIVLTKITQDRHHGVIIEINSETDFVAKSYDFRSFGAKVITLALNEHIIDVDTLKAKFEEQRIDLVNKIGENINIRRLGVLEGDLVGSYLHGTCIGVIVSVVGANEKLAKHIAMHIAASIPKYVNTVDIPASIVAREHLIQLDIAMRSGKSRKIAEKIVEGRMNKFINELALISQHFVIDPSKTVGQLLGEHNAKVNNFIRFKVGDGIEKY